jgi:hypothetical protein
MGIAIDTGVTIPLVVTPTHIAGYCVKASVVCYVSVYSPACSQNDARNTGDIFVGV